MIITDKNGQIIIEKHIGTIEFYILRSLFDVGIDKEGNRCLIRKIALFRILRDELRSERGIVLSVSLFFKVIASLEEKEFIKTVERTGFDKGGFLFYENGYILLDRGILLLSLLGDADKGNLSQYISNLSHV